MILSGRMGVQRADPSAYDPSYGSVYLLLKGEGTVNQPVFLDESVNNLSTSSRILAVNTSTFAKFGSGSIKIIGLNASFTYASSTNWDLGTGSWTFESWIYVPSFGGTGAAHITQGGGNRGHLWVDATNLNVYTGVGTISAAHGGFSLNTWHHCAWCKASGVNNPGFFLDGAAKSITSGSGTAWGTGAQTMAIGRNDGTTHSDRYVDEVRYTRGVIRYTGAYTVPFYSYPKIT
jgi:hypothetical protein